MAALPAAETQSWRATLALDFKLRADRTVLARSAHCGPLRVQRPFHPEGKPCHVYVLHPPGGVVGGDHLYIDIDVTERAHALLTTPASGKFYRSDGRLARQQQRLRVASGATLEWLPQDTILFDGCNVDLNTHVQLGTDARFIGWELLTLGRPACGERFESGTITQRFELWNDSRPLVIERAAFRGGDAALDAAWGLHGCATFGTFVATGADRATLEVARAAVVSTATTTQTVAFTLKGGVLLGRALGQGARGMQQRFADIWAEIRPLLLHCEPSPPRVWRT